ncbi:MAG: HD domain-containing protein, partial [Patescibacteria group bacterium]
QQYMVWAAERAARDAKDILAGAIYRFAAPTSVEHGHHNIIVPRDDIKGRIVGRGGRSVAFFENLFGVDVIFNDEPNLIIVSCFNLVQREVARLALERLMREKNITEEVITRAKFLADQDMEKILKREGDKALKILGMENVNPELSKLLGRLKFRTSYGQCIMSHCFEVAYFSRLLASEIGANERVAWIAGFFHDVGKAIDQESGGSHDVLTKEILEKYKFSPEIVHAAWTHHDAAPQETIEARIVQAADAISAGRPGARAESVERYLEKIKALEETATSFAGVKKAYAINAGREVRVIVEPDRIKDSEVGPMANQIAAKVQEQGGYPGKIKVIAIRTTKTTDYAK